MQKAMVASALIHFGLIAGAWVVLSAQPEVNEADAESVSVSIISMDMLSTEPSEVVTSSNQNTVSAGGEHEAAEVPEVAEAEPVTEEVVETAEAVEAEIAEPIAETVVAEAPTETIEETSETEELASAVVLTATADGSRPVEASIPQVVSEAATIVADTVKPSQSDPLEQLRTASISELTPAEPTQKLPQTLVKPVEAIKPVQEANLSPVVEEVEETAETAPVPLPRIVRKPVDEPAEPKKAEPKPKETPKKKAEPSKKPATEAKPQKQQPTKQANLGNGGNAEADAAASSKPGGGKGRKDDGGSAAASKYPGLVQAKVTRSAKYPTKAKGKAGEALVSFVVGSGGNVSRVALVRSSGNAVLDDAAVAAVNRAAPFPPIPEAAGRSSWAFTVPVYFKK